MITKEPVPSAAAALASPALLDKIDKLFACNVGSYIGLPQIVAVGDQSSGKSSVLEGLTGLPFPRDSGLCTRFATQIIFKRSLKESISVSIIPAKDASGDHVSNVSAWKKDGVQALDSETFATIMREAQSVMGVGEGGNTFCEDVLKLELSGPNREHLSIVDVPGIFENVSEDGTTEADRRLVRNMVLSYMENPRSVMLAVIPANVDPATQGILSMAKDVDPQGKRTMGILTKPDLVDEGAESKVLELMLGRKYRLALGWHIVRNLGQKHLGDTSVDRNSIEWNFFKTEYPWNTLDKDVISVQSLQIRLQEVLNNHVKAEFPKVRSELNQRLKEKNTLLDALGRSRATREDQAAYLTEMASEVVEVQNKALMTIYSSETFDENPALKIATLAVSQFDSFRELVMQNGHLYKFDCRTGTDIDHASSKTRNVPTPADLQHLLAEPSEILAPFDADIDDWLGRLYDTSRGFELGTFQASILPTAMREQSKKWSDLGLGFISDMISLAHMFCMVLLEKVAIDHVKFLLFVERENAPITTNTDFMSKLQTRRYKRHEVNLESTPEDIADRLRQLMKDLSMSNRDQVIQEIHDITKSYYDIAVARFVDNVCQQAAGHYLINGPDTPLKLFSPKFVSSLTEQQLASIAGDDPATKRKRAQLLREIEDLEAGRKILFSV